MRIGKDNQQDKNRNDNEPTVNVVTPEPAEGHDADRDDERQPKEQTAKGAEQEAQEKAKAANKERENRL